MSFIDLQMDEHKVIIFALQVFDFPTQICSNHLENSMFSSMLLPGKNLCQHELATLQFTSAWYMDFAALLQTGQVLFTWTLLTGEIG